MTLPKIEKRTILFRVIEAVLLILFLMILVFFVNRSIVNLYDRDMEQALWDTSFHITETYHNNIRDYEIRQQLFEAFTRVSMQFIEEEPVEFTDEKMKELTDTFGTDGVYILDAAGNVVAASDTVHRSFVREQMVRLLDVRSDRPISDVIYLREVLPLEDPETVLSEKSGISEDDVYSMVSSELLIAGMLGPDRILVLRENENKIMTVDTLSIDVGETLLRTQYGPNGFYMLGTGEYVMYSPFVDEDVTSYDQLGLSKDVLHDPSARRYKVFGRDYLVKAIMLEDELPDMYLICFLPFSEIQNSVLFVTGGEVAAVLLALWVMHVSQKITSGRKDRKNVSLKRKLVGGFLIGVVITICLSALTGTLFLYSSETRDTRLKANDLSFQIADLDYLQKEGNEVYCQYMERLVRTTARLISVKEELRSDAGLRKLAEDLNVDAVLLYDSSGTVIASSRNYTGLSAPYDASTPAGEFRWLLYGKAFIVQDTPIQNYLDAPYYFSGAPIQDAEGNYNGFVQLAFDVDFHDEMVRSVSLESTISSFGGNMNMVMMAVDQKTKKIISPMSYLDGMTTEDAGFPEIALKGKYTGFSEVFQSEAILCSVPDADYAALVTYDSLMTGLNGCLTGLVLSIYGIVTEILFLVLRFSEIEHEKTQQAGSMEGILSRSIIEAVPYLLAGTLVLTMVLSRFLLTELDVAYYVFVNQWANGVHIYSITRCLLIICTAGIIYAGLNVLISALYPFMSTRHETVLRMGMSILKYAFTVGTIIICASTLGAPTTSLLAISGVVTLIISMGAQSLVADILAGLFIIFEGTYKVGDMITIDQWHGQVTEIGIRNTRVFDLVENNVKIINNSTIKNIINFSECPSRASITIAIDYEQDYERLEAIFRKEMEEIRSRVQPKIRDLRLKGIEEFQDSGILLKFDALCKNEDYPDVQRSLRKEIKAMFDRNGIPVPFPQVVLSNREDAKPMHSVPAPVSEEETGDSKNA